MKGPGTYKIPETEKEKQEDEAGLTAVYYLGGANSGAFWDAHGPGSKGTVTFRSLSATGAAGKFGVNAAGAPRGR